MDKRLNNNREMWNALTGAHVDSEFYDVEGFKKGRQSLMNTELEEVGDVKGKSMLHLQCHFGMNTLSWGRLGAEVTGVDFSEDAIEYANKLSKEINVKAEFIQSDIYALPEVLDKKFDIVFTSYGVICWLPNLEKWAEIIADYLKPGGFFYIVEIHPILQVFYNEDARGDSSGLQIRNNYFPKSEPVKYEGGSDYASELTHDITSYEWQHTLADITTALIDAGLRIDFLHEFPVCCFQALPEMTLHDDGWWHLEGDRLPLTYSIKATKP